MTLFDGVPEYDILAEGEKEELALDDLDEDTEGVAQREADAELVTDGAMVPSALTEAILAVAQTLPIELWEAKGLVVESCDRVRVTAGELDCSGELLERGDREPLAEGERE